MDRDKMITVLDMIAMDAESDVSEFEGKPFTGRNVADFNGKQNAMISALAKILREFIKGAN